MSVNKSVSVRFQGKRNYKVNYEMFNSAAELIATNASRKNTDSSFKDVKRDTDWRWAGCKSYEDAYEMLRVGYQPTVDSLKGVFNASVTGEGKRFTQSNNIVGFAPIVPLALKGVPQAMLDMRIRPIKAKVIDVYYDMTASCGTDSEAIINAGKGILSAIIELEKQGYRFNLYAVQTYSDDEDCDMLAVKVKSSGQPLDLKRISFPLTHTAFFRVIGFEWYGKLPTGKYRSGYGCALSYDHSVEEMNVAIKSIFGNNAIYFAAAHLVKQKGKNLNEYVKGVVTNANSKN